ncbi:MAG: thiamine pyrophosphate-dependent enzyme, partial [Halobacteriales archaeon]|nr:thiamine pyrophosphate-dependent enzyme [Halobacteriales archaeon]
LQQDGDLFQFPNALWVLGHLELPLLNVVHNNQSLYNSTNHRIQLASYRGRDASLERAMIGTGLDDPVPDWASVAEAFGVDGYGPVEDPDELQPVLTEAWEAAKAGRPVLVDVVSQAR